MNRYVNIVNRQFTLQQKKDLILFCLFHVLFYMSMWISKTLHPIYFQSENKVQMFGLSYSLMALMGYFSFVFGRFVDRHGYQKSLWLGFILYGFGLTLRAQTDYIFVVLSSVFSGTGASVCLSAFRIWMIDLSDTTIKENNESPLPNNLDKNLIQSKTKSQKTKYVGLKSAMTSLGTALGCLAAGGLPLIIPQLSLNLSLAGFVLLSLSFVMLFTNKELFHSKNANLNKIENDKSRNFFQPLLHGYRIQKKLMILTSLLGVLTGFYVSFISPFLPTLLQEKGLSLSAIGLSLASFSLIRFFIDPILGRWIDKYSEKAFRYFFLAEVVIFLVTASFLIFISKKIFILFMIIRSISMGVSTIAEEIVWLKIFPEKHIGLFFGINQSAFFVGDFLGGIINSKLISEYGLNVCILLSLGVILVNAAFFIKLQSMKT